MIIRDHSTPSRIPAVHILIIGFFASDAGVQTLRIVGAAIGAWMAWHVYDARTAIGMTLLLCAAALWR